MKALVLGSGGLRGAYDAGVAATLCRELGPDYFDAVYMSSVGVFNGAFFVANEPGFLEHTWRKFVSGNQLVNYFNPLKGRNILDTEYLIEIFQDGRAYLSVESLFSTNVKMVFTVENLETGAIEYIQPKREIVFDLMRAATAVPLVHKPVEIAGKLYSDGGMVDPLPVRKALEDGYQDITAVYGKPKNFYVGTGYKIGLPFISRAVQPKVRKQLERMEETSKELQEFLDNQEDIAIIRPDKKLDGTLLTTSKRKINDLVDLGIQDAKAYLEMLA